MPAQKMKLSSQQNAVFSIALLEEKKNFQALHTIKIAASEFIPCNISIF